MLRRILGPQISQHMFRCIFVLAGIWRISSTKFELHFVSSLSWEGFSQLMVKCNLCVLSCMGGVLRWIKCRCWLGRGLVNTCWDAYWVLVGVQHMLRFILFPHWHGRSDKPYFVSSLIFEGFCQQKLRYILCPLCHEWGLVNTCWDAFYVLAT